jgi:hypothetical protein
MYCVTLENNFKILQVFPQNRKKFLVKGKIVKIPKSGIVVFPENTEIAVGKILYHEFQKTLMRKNKSILHHNSGELQAEKRANENGTKYTVVIKEIDESETLLSSIEIVEKI